MRYQANNDELPIDALQPANWREDHRALNRSLSRSMSRSLCGFQSGFQNRTPKLARYLFQLIVKSLLYIVRFANDYNHDVVAGDKIVSLCCAVQR